MYSLPIEQISQHLLRCIDKLLCKLIVLGFLITDGSYAINAFLKPLPLDKTSGSENVWQ